MLQSSTLSLTKLTGLSKCTQKGISTRGGKEQFPATPTLLKALGMTSTKWINWRDSIISHKKDIHHVYDERLRPYQNADVSFLSQLKAKAIFNEQRTGKTPTSLVTMKVRKENRNIIIVPKSTVYPWLREYRRWHGGHVATPNQWWTKKRRVKFYNEFEGTIILSYGIATNDYEELLDCARFDAILVDEAHRLRNYKGMRSKTSTKQSKAILRLRKHADGAYALTGTPAPNYAYNVFGILAFLYPDLFTSYWRYIEFYYGIETQELYQRNITLRKESKQFASPELELIHTEFLESISVQRKRRDVMQWLPKIEKESIVLPMLPKQKKMYDELEQYYEYEDIICVALLDQMIRLRQTTTCPSVLAPEVRGSKEVWLQDYIDDNPEQPIVIASMFTSALKQIAVQLNIEQASILQGSLDAKNRERIIREFQKGKRNILLAQTDVIKEGVKLSRAETLIVLDPSLTYTDNLQLYDRIVHTSSQEIASKPQKIILLQNDKTIDMVLQRMLDIKKTSTEIVNEYSSILNALRSRGR